METYGEEGERDVERLLLEDIGGRRWTTAGRCVDAVEQERNDDDVIDDNDARGDLLRLFLGVVTMMMLIKRK